MKTQKIFEFEGENNSVGRDNLRHSAEIERLTFLLQEGEMETACTQSQREDAQSTLNSGSCAAEKCAQQVSDQEIQLS